LGTQFKKWLIGFMFLNLLTVSLIAHASEDEDEVVEAPPVASDFRDERPQQVFSPNGMIEGHRLIAENHRLELYLEESTLSIIIRDRASSTVMYSTVANPEPGHNQLWENFMGSAVVVETLTGTAPSPTRWTVRDAGTQITVRLTEDGFEADVFFPTPRIGYTLIVQLTETGFTAEIPDSSWIEEGDNLISSLYLFPFLNYSHLGSRDGYMFVPDGSGILINLEDNEGRFSQPFTGAVFGQNVGVQDRVVPNLLLGQNIIQSSQPILMPVFGKVHTDSQIGFLGIIEGGGEFHSSIEAFPNGAVTNYDWISNRFIYRQQFSQPVSQAGGVIRALQDTRNRFDARINFQIVTGDAANYTGLALAYQRYLLEKGILEVADFDFRVRLDFLGLEQERGMFFNRNVVMTSIDDVQTILATLNESGVENILAIYEGWQRRGRTVGSMVQSFDVASALGGRQALLDLQRGLTETGTSLFLMQDPLRLNPNVNSGLRFSAMRSITRQTFIEETDMPLINGFNFLRPDAVRTILEQTNEQFLSHGMDNLVLTGISNQLFSHYHQNALLDRHRTAQEFAQAAAEVNENFNLLLDQPFAYLWGYTEAFLNTPVHGSNYIFTTEEIPFLGIVLRGIIPMYSEPINFEANRQEFILRLIDHGVMPTFYLTKESPELLINTNSRDIFTSQFSMFEDDIVRYYFKLGEVFAKTQGATVESRRREGDLVTLRFSNGVVIYLNYSQSPVHVDGSTIQGLSYKVGGY